MSRFLQNTDVKMKAGIYVLLYCRKQGRIYCNWEYLHRRTYVYESCTINLLTHALLLALSTFAWGYWGNVYVK